jgi:glutathionylspermidine synthase
MCFDYREDYMTAHYLRDTAMRASLTTEYIEIQDIGWNSRRNAFVDLREQPIPNMFKLYPWKWMLREQFGPQLLRNTTRWLEPPWKALPNFDGNFPIIGSWGVNGHACGIREDTSRITGDQSRFIPHWFR